MQTDYIKTFSGVILGIIETDDRGNQTAKDFSTRRILGYYFADQNVTTDFYRNILGRGNSVASLIYKEHPEAR